MNLSAGEISSVATDRGIELIKIPFAFPTPCSLVSAPPSQCATYFCTSFASKLGPKNCCINYSNRYSVACRNTVSGVVILLVTCFFQELNNACEMCLGGRTSTTCKSPVETRVCWKTVLNANWLARWWGHD